MLPRPHPRQPTLPPSPRPTRAVRAQAARGTTLGGGGPRALPGPGGQARPASPGRRLWDAGFRAVTLRPTFGAELFLCPQAGRIRQAGHRSDRILWFHVLSPAAGRLSTGSGAVVNSSGDLSPRFSTGSRTGALTPCGEHGIVLATRPPAGRRSSLCKGKAEREPENCRGSRHGYQPQRCSRVLLGPHRSSSARPSPGVHLRPSRRTDGRRRASPGRGSRARRPRSVRHGCGRTALGHQGTADPRPGRGMVGTVSRRARPLREASSRGQTRCTRTRPADRRTLILKLPLPLIPVARQAPSRFTNPCDEKLLRAGPSTRISQVADLGR